MANASILPSIEMSRRAFLFVGTAVIAAGGPALSSTPAHAAAPAPAVNTAGGRSRARAHRTLLGVL